MKALFHEDESVLSRAAGPPDGVLEYGAAPEQIAELRVGRAGGEPRPLVLIVHGGFWRPRIDRAHAAPMADALAAAGWTVALLEYRRMPGQPEATLEDLRCALERLPRRIEGHDGRSLMMGHSAGGHLVLWSAVNCPGLQSGALALAPVADLRLAQQARLGDGAVSGFLGTDARDRPELDPRQLATPAIPTTIIHGSEDATVPIALSESYVAAHAAVRLVRCPDVGHYALIDPLSGAWGTVLKELARLATRS
jgi:acetyl esterase/lipase